MNDLQSYMGRARTEEKRLRIQKQWNEAYETAAITCHCGQLRCLMVAYRCLYCGEWFCFNCAELHFGQTLREYFAERDRLSGDISAWLEEQRNAQAVKTAASLLNAP